VIANWEIKLEAVRDKDELLSLLRKLFNGVVLSSLSSLAPLVELCHVLVQLFFSMAKFCWLTADGLVSRVRCK